MSRRRVRELESELERAKGEVETAIRSGGSQLRDVIGEKTGELDVKVFCCILTVSAGRPYQVSSKPPDPPDFGARAEQGVGR